MLLSQMVLQMIFSDDISCDISVNANNSVDDSNNGYDSDIDDNGNNEDKDDNNVNDHNFDSDYGNGHMILMIIMSIMLLSCHVRVSE